MNDFLHKEINNQLENHSKIKSIINENINTIKKMIASFELDGNVSEYWKAEIKGFLYLFENYPLVYEKLREHCYHITGVKSYDYRDHHFYFKKEFKQKFRKLKNLDKSNLFIEESSRLGGFGFDIDGKLINIDTLKFYEFLIGLDFVGFLEIFKKDTTKTILEIGSGWGGFAFQFKKLFPKSTYVLVDLPHTFLFSLNYLKVHFPDKKFLIIDDNLKDFNLAEYDFVFCPSNKIKLLNNQKIDLAINMVSFQEMTSKNIIDYSEWLKINKVKYLYSLNRDRSKHNTELTTVTQELFKYFNLSYVYLLKEDYNKTKKIITNDSKPTIRNYVFKKHISYVLEESKKDIIKEKLVRIINKISLKILKRKIIVKKKTKINTYDYRHLCCKLKD
jgi:putative sugar O-methyltransferase